MNIDWAAHPTLYQACHPWHWMTYGSNSTAVATVIGIPISIATLGFLICYVRDTSRLVRIGQDQLEVSSKPVIAVTTINGDVVIKNCGPGPALNLAWMRYLDVCRTKDENRSIFPLGDSASAGSLENLAFSQIGDSEWKYFVDYESVSGQKYRTTATWDKSNDLKIHLRIEKLDQIL